MTSRHIDLGAARLVLAGLLLGGCFGDAPATDEESQAATGSDGTSTPISQLPLAGTAGPGVLGELLAKPTALGETVALHVRLPPPNNAQLAQSLVRVVGSPASPQVLFRSDTLAKLGAIKKSPGKDFFTVFTKLPAEELDKLVANAGQIASGSFGETTSESVVFDGRAATARVVNPKIDPNLLRQVGVLAPVNGCFIRPVSTLAAWGKSLFITDPAIVQDPARTWDPCTGAGVKGGLWTFAHLMREMANGSGTTPENFVKEWLSMWLNNYAPNGDNVPARTAIFNQVIQPWAAADGGTATLGLDMFGKLVVDLSKPLKLEIAPFRLVAIVNRIDLGRTVNGVGGYGGSSTSLPVTAGELRFIFNVVQPSPWGGGTEASCGRKRFTTIFEYGVPGEGCDAVVAWARQWTGLAAMPGFTPAYKAQLQAMTESVVRHGAAPNKGNQNAINQVRTNEIALGSWWELREFTLTAEDPLQKVDPPANGLLRKHTVALTPNDGAFSAGGADPTINAFVNGPATASVPLPAANPNHCLLLGYRVPFSFGGLDFRGGNSLVPPGHWRANSITAASPAANICARHQFSLNTCNGCHRDDSGTNGLGGSTSFTHIDPLSPIPVRLSKFLTGGGPGLVFNVNDTQLGAPAWPFADLERRFQRLFDLSHCTSCATIFAVRPEIIDDIRDMNRFVPVDIDPGDPVPFEVGPITDITVVQKLLDLRTTVAGDPTQQPVDVIRATEVSAH